MNFNIPLDRYSHCHLHSDLFLKSFCKYCNEINIRGEHKGVHTISSADSPPGRQTGIISQDRRCWGWRRHISQPGDPFLMGKQSVQQSLKKIAGLIFCASSDKVSELAFNRTFAVLLSEVIAVLGMWQRERRRAEVPILATSSLSDRGGNLLPLGTLRPRIESVKHCSTEQDSLPLAQISLFPSPVF